MYYWCVMLFPNGRGIAVFSEEKWQEHREKLPAENFLGGGFDSNVNILLQEAYQQLNIQKLDMEFYL